MRGVLTPTGAIRASWAVLMVLVAALLVAGACVVYTGHTARETEERQERARQEADRRWCAVLAVQAAPEPPPTTERGHRLQREAVRLMAALGCER